MKFLFLFLFIISFQNSFAGHNLKIIDQNNKTGFAIYRSGKPDMDDFVKLCKMGIDEIMVLSGDAEKREYKYMKKNHPACKNIRVVFNKKTTTVVSLNKPFLKYFDQWVREAKRSGKKILFRCKCGCHRTGRLAAYYQMKYQNLSLTDARALAKKHGKVMTFYKHIFKQINALYDHVKKKPCSTKTRNCVRAN